MNDRTESSTDLEAFRAWLVEIAEEEGSSPEAVLEQLMSTYWILNELTEVMDETPFEAVTEGGEISEEADRDEILEVIETMAEMQSAQSAPEPATASGIDPGVIQLIEALKSDQSPTGGFDGGAAYRLERLQEEVNDLSSTVSELQSRTDGLDESLETALSEQEERLGELEAELEALEASTVDPAELEDFEADMELRQAEVDNHVDRLEANFEEAYDTIERILDHLLTSTEQTETQLDAILDLMGSQVEDLAAANDDYQRLIDLKREANRHGFASVTCDSCDEPIDIALLAEPFCPSCDRPIVGYEKKSSFFRTRRYAKTRAHRGDRETGEQVEELRDRLDQVDLGDGGSEQQVSLEDE